MSDRSNDDAVAFYERAARRREAKPDGEAKPGLTREYDRKPLSGAEAEAVGFSFGCGDPLAFAELCQGDTVLDLGCGAGLDLLIAAEKVGPQGRAIGVDASAEMLSRAAANARKAGYHDRIELVLGTIDSPPVAEASIDWVISNCVLNLADDKARVLHEIYRVLKPGGRMLIADLVVEDLPDWVRSVAGDAAWINNVMSEKEYARCAEAAGLSEVNVAGRTPFDAGMVRALVEDELPIALETISSRLQMEKRAFLDMAGEALAGHIVSIKLEAKKPRA